MLMLGSFAKGILELEQLDDLAHLSERMQNRPLRLLLDDELKKDFLDVDFTRLRRYHQTVRAPPPKVTDKQGANNDKMLELDEIHVRPFRCDITVDGKPCGERFVTWAKLRCHKARSKLPGHSWMSVAAMLVAMRWCCL